MADFPVGSSGGTLAAGRGRSLATPLLALLLFFALLAPAGAQVELGIDVLKQHQFSILQGKRVGLVTNHTGIDSNGVKTRKILAAAKGVRLVALFAPEHGLDGVVGAGKYVASRKDKLTGLPVYSLYGPTRKPTAAMLKGLDVLVYDMQDIGSRSYTYISTMAKCMEAAGEVGIPFVVLDRPNPLGGLRVEGPPMEPQWISFVGQLPVPYVHGMTSGELAQMANSKGWVQPKCNLTVVKMHNWQRGMTWNQTGLHWIATSPNIPHATSPFYYVATGLAGEVEGIETGCGGPEPFQIAASKWTDAEKFTAYMRSLNLRGISFKEYSRNGFQGARIRIDPDAQADLCALGVYILAAAQKAAPRSLFTGSASKYDIFYKCYGSDSIRRDIERGVSPSKIVSGWSAYNVRFVSERKPFLLYP
ncbi:MAG: DUF1343 domain-containing protein [Verrucomicrobia bacterium]|nr:DUF1343 domain-containing protein [Verrucomicrobiota bacterium]